MTFEEVVQRFTMARVGVPGKRVKLDFGSAGRIVLDGQGNVSRDDGPADATLELSFEDFAKMADATLDPTSAFMQNRLRVSGDLGVAMQLQAALQTFQRS